MKNFYMLHVQGSVELPLHIMLISSFIINSQLNFWEVL
jgi:hypothetical protein